MGFKWLMTMNWEGKEEAQEGGETKLLTEGGRVMAFFSDSEPSFVSTSAQPCRREAPGSCRGICSNRTEGRAKEASSHCQGQKHLWVLSAPLTLQSGERGSAASASAGVNTQVIAWEIEPRR